MQDAFDKTAAAIRGSQILRLLLVGFLALLLQIPIASLGRLVSERQERRQAAIEEVSSKWGNPQAITGPVLVVPYTLRTEISSNGQRVVHTEDRNAIFLPERLLVRGTINSETRTRGIFAIPVYGLHLTLEGEFGRPSFSELGVEPSAVAWDHAQLCVGISDVRAIQEQPSLSWNGNEVALLPGTGGFTDISAGIHAVVGSSQDNPGYKFAFPLALNGSQGINFAPFARNTVVEVQSNSRNPSFQGNWLPTERTVSDMGFSARWTIPFLGRNYPQAWTSEANMREAIEGSRFGVQLVDPVDHYRMAERSVKYAGLFILLTYTSIWLIEVLAGVRVHPIQYLLLGVALCLFYLLELSLSEHLGFTLAYGLACSLITGMVASYSFVVLQRVSRALIVASGVAALYSYLYVLLTNEDNALLAGTLGLFVILGTIMFVTRRVDWYAVGARSGAATGSSSGGERAAP
jgi:inner membrane protein